jgi:dCMP deaminase
LALIAVVAFLTMADGTDGTSAANTNKYKPTHLSPLKASLAAESSRSPTHIPCNTESVAPSNPPVFTSPLSHDEIGELLLQEANYDCNAPTTTPKRSSYLSWDDYFMAIAFLSARRSKDPKAPTGACLVDADNRVIGIGYNGFPRGCSDDLLPWQHPASSDAPILHTSSPYECHAEMNAILNKCSADVAGAKLYTPHYPCT